MDQASKTPKNFNPRAFTFKDLKNNKSLISSKLEICCEDRSIHFPTKVKKISYSSQVQRRQNQRVLFCKRIEQRLYSLFINTNLYLQTIFLFNCLIFYNWKILCLQIFGTPDGTIATSHLFFINLSYLLKSYGFKEDSNQQPSFWNK